jgi:hypothetical protein
LEVRSSRSCTRATRHSITGGDLLALSFRAIFQRAPNLPRGARLIGVSLISEKQANSWEAGSQISGLPSASLATLKPSDSQSGFHVGRILDLRKQGLSISGLSSGWQQFLAPVTRHPRVLATWRRMNAASPVYSLSLAFEYSETVSLGEPLLTGLF